MKFFRLPTSLTGLLDQARCQDEQAGAASREVLKGPPAGQGHLQLDAEQLALEAALEESAMNAALEESRRMAGLGTGPSRPWQAQQGLNPGQHTGHSISGDFPSLGPKAGSVQSGPGDLPARDSFLGHAGTLSEEEMVQLALKLSVSDTTPSRPPCSPWTDYLNGGRLPRHCSASDESLARALQQAEVDHAAVRVQGRAVPPLAQTPAAIPVPTAPALPPLISFSPPPGHSWRAPAGGPLAPTVDPSVAPRAVPGFQAGATPTGAHPTAPGWAAYPRLGDPGPPDTSNDAALAASLYHEDAVQPQPRASPGSYGFGAPSAAQRDTSNDAALAALLGKTDVSRRAVAAVPGPAPRPPHPCGNACGGCGRRLGFCTMFGGANPVSALGRMWHKECFKCGLCGAVIAGGSSFLAREGVPYHSACLREKMAPRCVVCKDHLPLQNGRYEFMTNTFWQDMRYCRAHMSDGTPSCCSCDRLRPNGEAWVELEDGRVICLACLDTIVVDTEDAKPLYNQILNFFGRMGMPLPVKPPLLLVEVSALNEAEVREGRPTNDAAAPAFHTRGLTLMQEYREMRTVVRQRSGGRRWYEVVPDLVQVPGPTSYEVTAILVLHGLPWLLTGAILAHEVMHAWLRLSGVPRLSAEVEEGLCQLMAVLWLESQPPSPEGMWEERLLSYFAHQIRTHPSPVYGDGFRAALEAFQAHGLPALVASVRTTGAFPAV